MKNQNTKPTKKKILMYYLVLAASLLVIAAITVGIVFAVRYRQQITLDKGNQEQPENPDNPDNPDSSDNPNNPDNPDTPDTPDNPDKPTDSTYTFICPVDDVNLSQAHVFGYDKTLDRYRLHEGIDLAATAGTDVRVALDGTVTGVAKSDVLFGAVVTVEHANGLTTVYKFIDPAETLKAGDKVSQGQVIGVVAVATGVENAEGDHLHFEVYQNGVMADPSDYLDVIQK